MRLLLCSLVHLLCLSARAAPAPLADAAAKADWERVAVLLKYHADTNATQADGASALHWAVHHDNLATVKSLLAAGADVKTANKYGVTPLFLACENGSGGIVTALLDSGADANTTLAGGESVLMTAARTGRVEPVKALLQRGAAVDAAERNGQTAIMWAAAEGHADVVQLLIGAKADFRRRLKSGFTAFHFAARNGRGAVVRTLLKAGCDVNEVIEPERGGGGRQPERGTSAQLLAVVNGHFELAMDLVKSGADPNDQRSGTTPLHALTMVRRPPRGDDVAGQPPPEGSGSLTSIDFIRQLVKAGADVNAKLKSGSSGAGKIGRTGATPFLLASQNADLEMMKLLVSLGADHRLTNNEGSTALMAAAGLGCTAPDEEPGTEEECLSAVEYLLSLGADLNATNSKGETAMHGAAYKSLPGMVHYLAKKGAKLEVWNRKNKHGWTPVMIAEGFRPGNFKPSAETLEALHQVMKAAGVTPPPPTQRPDPVKPDR